MRFESSALSQYKTRNNIVWPANELGRIWPDWYGRVACFGGAVVVLDRHNSLGLLYWCVVGNDDVKFSSILVRSRRMLVLTKPFDTNKARTAKHKAPNCNYCVWLYCVWLSRMYYVSL